MGVVGRVDGGRSVGAQRVGLQVQERATLHVSSLDGVDIGKLCGDGRPLGGSNSKVKLVGNANKG